VAFHVRDVAVDPPPAARYDLVCVLEAVHDMARPVEALAGLRAMAGDDGTVLVMDERTAEAFADATILPIEHDVFRFYRLA
jgi:hypothetical protein